MSEEKTLYREQVESYRAARGRYIVFAKTLEDIFTRKTTELGLYAFIQSRAKDIASFAEKILRKKYSDPLAEMSDLCGVRVIVHTLSEIDLLDKFIRESESLEVVEKENILDDRLAATEFGYVSWHYIVKLKGKAVAEAETLKDLKAEVQVRTLLQHAWADINHDIGYKNSFKLPPKWQRAFARIAALLEEADKEFDNIRLGLKKYEASYDSPRTKNQLEEEETRLNQILDTDPKNYRVAYALGKIRTYLGWWEKAVEVFLKYENSLYQPLLRDLGVALCKIHRGDSASPGLRQGREYLERSITMNPNDSDALASLGGSWRDCEGAQAQAKALEYYRKAFEVDPTDPYPMGNYLEYEIVNHKDVDIVSYFRAQILSAEERLRSQIEVGMNLPWAYYDLGKFSLFLKAPFEALFCYAKGVESSSEKWYLETALKTPAKLINAGVHLPGLEWIRDFLHLALDIRFGEGKGSSERAEPVVIITGGCAASEEHNMQSYREMTLAGFAGYKGTIFSGGTRHGISAFAGDLQEAYPKAIRAIGYLPEKIPQDVERDSRYSELRATPETDFSIAEPLAYWSDLKNSKKQVREIKLLGIGGGNISACEYRMALAFGVSVGIIEGSGREADRLLSDPLWNKNPCLVKLKPDSGSVADFLRTGDKTA